MEKWMYAVLAAVVVIIIHVIRTYLQVQNSRNKMIEFQKKVTEGVKVVTVGGLIGVIRETGETSCRLQIADGVVVSIERYSIKNDMVEINKQIQCFRVFQDTDTEEAVLEQVERTDQF